MKSRLGGAMAAFLLIAGGGLALAADDAMTGRINHGSLEVANPPPSTSGSMPNALDDPARNLADSAKSSAVNSGAATAGPQNAAIGTAPANAPPGASPQTMPSTLSPQNAAEDRLSWMQRALQLSDEEKQALRSSLLGDKDAKDETANDSRVANAKIGHVLPSSVVMHELPPEALQKAPEAHGFKYVRAGDRLLIVAPESWIVVGVL